ncbi:MAG: potassium transporter TrkG, partial [Paracoccaceae bacterium]
MKKLPFLVVLMGLGAISMFVPMAHAVRISDFATAQTFFLSGMLSLLLTGLIAVASVNHSTRVNARSSLLGLLGAFVFLPAMLAWPLWYLVDDAAFFRLYFEMLSCLTTTGATLFDASANLSDPVNLWRALVGWLGGFLMLLAAVSILVPLNLGGIEVYARPRSTRIAGGTRQIKAADASERLLAFARKLAPIYAAMTIALAFGLFLSGERVFVAVVHAMATLSTSGIRAVGVQGYGTSGLTGEAIVFVFLLIAASRATISALQGRIRPTEVLRDHEFATMTIIVLILPLIMFLRHWSVAPDIAAAGNIRAALLALWGSVFTVLSFLTTTGFESAHWAGARDWSGLHGPGILLMGLAVTGGGIATTAGGVKLLRVYALYRHGARE